MECKKVHEKLIFYSYDELNSFENEGIKTHLQNCENCYNLYTELEATINLIKKKKNLEPNPFLYTRIKQKLEVIENEKNQPVFSPAFIKVLQPVFLLFLLAISLISGIELGNTFEIKQQEEISMSQTTEFYFNDFHQEKLEVLLLND